MPKLKTIAAAAALLMAATLPINAANMTAKPPSTCNDASMKTLQSKIDGMTDTAQKKTAMDELARARLSVKADKLKDCSMHLDSAMKAAGGAM